MTMKGKSGRREQKVGGKYERASEKVRGRSITHQLLSKKHLTQAQVNCSPHYSLMYAWLELCYSAALSYIIMGFTTCIYVAGIYISQ